VCSGSFEPFVVEQHSGQFVEVLHAVCGSHLDPANSRGPDLTDVTEIEVGIVTRTMCGIVPPHILRALAERGEDRARIGAQRTLDQDSLFRARRSSLRPLHQTAWGSGFVTARLLGRPRRLQTEAGATDRTIYDARHTTRLPGWEVRAEADPPSEDLAVDEAYDYMGDTYAFYQAAYERDSIDDAGLPLVGTVHYDVDYDNAFWDGSQMVFGDGDGEVFNRFTIAVDVIGHELTHGVTDSEAGLIYWGQAGALNESVSDVFGSLVKQAVLGQTADQADWLIGEGLLTDQVNGVALRSMARPGTAFDDPALGGRDPQPADMSDYVHTSDDNGGVHINSGIPNRAFYLAAVQIGGNAWESAGQIWYDTLTSPTLRPFTQFAGFARLTVNVASQLFGTSSLEAQAVSDAWNEVGVRVGNRAQVASRF
jgi:Zn-dependent metalloprotease